MTRAGSSSPAPRQRAGRLPRPRGSGTARAERPWPAPDACRAAAGQVQSALRVCGHFGCLGPGPAAGRERTRGSGLSALQPRGAAVQTLVSLTRVCKSELENSLRAQPPSSLSLPPQSQVGVGRVPPDWLEGKPEAGRLRPHLLRLPLHHRPSGSTPHFFVLKAPPPPKGFSPAGRL